MQAEGQQEAEEGDVELPEAPLPASRPSDANLAELAKRKEANRRKEEGGAAREGQLTQKERRATGEQV